MNTLSLSKSVRRAVAVGVIGAYASSLGTFTAAANDLGTPKATIRYGDLDLATSRGAKVLYERIISAAYEVCRPFDRDRLDNDDPWAALACRKQIIADAVAKIDKPALSALYNAKKPRAPIVIAETRK